MPNDKKTTKLGAAILMKQFRQLSQNSPEGIFVGLVDDDVYHWHVMMQGPEATAYEGGYFKARLKFPDTFPNR